jgi:hypothetical protein
MGNKFLSEQDRDSTHGQRPGYRQRGKELFFDRMAGEKTNE